MNRGRAGLTPPDRVLKGIPRWAMQSGGVKQLSNESLRPLNREWRAVPKPRKPSNEVGHEGIVPSLVGWVSGAQPTGRKAMPFGGLRFADPPYRRHGSKTRVGGSQSDRRTGMRLKALESAVARSPTRAGRVRW